MANPRGPRIAGPAHPFKLSFVLTRRYSKRGRAVQSAAQRSLDGHTPHILGQRSWTSAKKTYVFNFTARFSCDMISTE